MTTIREQPATDWCRAFEEVLDACKTACEEFYGERLVSLAVFGSVGRRTMRPDSDIDLLVVAYGLPKGRMRRVAEFVAVERCVEPILRAKESAGVRTRLSPLIRTPSEIEAGSAILLDMTEDLRALFDRDRFLERRIEKLRQRLKELGARRVRTGDAWWWDLKPDFKPGEVFTL